MVRFVWQMEAVKTRVALKCALMISSGLSVMTTGINTMLPLSVGSWDSVKRVHENII